MPSKSPVKRAATRPPKSKPVQRSLKIVGIGASAGGLEAFTELLRSLPNDADIAYVLVQHLDPTHRSLLSELLAKTTTLPVEEITDPTRVAPNHVYVIPPNSDLTISHGVLHLTPRDKGAGPARSIDHFLQSLARDLGENAVGVILSGAGSDGAQGLKAIKEAGGVTFAQDAGSSKYDSMPRSAVATGCVDFVLPPTKIAEELARLLQDSGPRKRRAAANARQRRGTILPKSSTLAPAARRAIPWPSAPEDSNLRKIFLLLRTRTGTDFSLYRLNTIRRRLARRLSLHKLKGLEAYARFLREHPEEVEALYQDILINVTSFFRNPSVFEVLKRKIFPRLIKHATEGDALRIWVAGCSTGQEPYSIAMAYTEFAAQNPGALPIQIFATDLNAAVLEQARSGRYTASQVNGLSAARLKNFFASEHGGYRVQKPIRDMVIFAQQNLLVDPPFTRVDLISCRNMLIYLEPALQQKIIPAFHYALKPNGVLVLGTSETVGSFSTLFAPLEKSHKIYAKKPAASWVHFERPPTTPAARAVRATDPAPRSREFGVVDAFKEADRVTLAKYSPVSVLVTEDGEILQFRGDVHRYLDLPSGKASFQLFKMAREGLALPLQKAFQRAKRENRVVRERSVRFDRRRGFVNFEIVPLKNLKARCFLILFEKTAARPKADTLALHGSGNGNGNGNGHGNGHAALGADSRELNALKQDYAEAREHLANLQEEHDTSVEELQASNEEVQSANEELQSLNEELETSNEELESANEELTTLNEELATRNAELRESELRLREQAQLLELAPVLARSPKDRIIFWNRGAEKLYGFTKEEALGQTAHLFLNAQFPEPLAKIEKELHRRGAWSGEVLHRRKDGSVICVASQWVLHHDANNKVRAILEVNSDISARKQAEESLRQSEAFNRSILESSPDCVKVLDLAGRIVFMNLGGRELMEIEDYGMIENAYWPTLWDGEGRAEAEKAYHVALSGASARFRAPCATQKGTLKWWDVVVRPILSTDGRPEKLLAVSRDVTAHRLAEIEVREDARWAIFRADVASAIDPASTVEKTYQAVSEVVARHFEAVFTGVWISDQAHASLELRGSAGLHGLLTGASPRLKLGELAIDRIARRREPVLSNDVGADASLCDPEWAAREGVEGFAGQPIVYENQSVGAICVLTKRPIAARALQELGQAAAALAQWISRKRAEEERQRLLQEAMEARSEVEVLNALGRMLAAELDLQKLTQGVTDAATRLARAEFGAFFYNTNDGDGHSHSLHALSGIERHAFDRFPLSARTAVFTPAIEGRRVVRSGDIGVDLSFAHNAEHSGLPTDQLPVKSYLAVPVMSRANDVIGALFLGHSKPDAFGEREERLVVNLAATAAIGMDNARLVNHLERVVGERTARLQDTIAELQAFSYTVSHDLRAPLRAMQSYAQVLLEDCGGQLTDQAREYLSRIENAGIRLDRLIQDVLTYSRIARAQVAVRPLDLEKLLGEIMQQYPMLQPPAAEIRIDGRLPLVLAEESSATQCLSNLLGNAVKFVPAGQKPRVTVRAEERAGHVRVWIEDNGIGIAPQDRERIFKMFERVDDANAYEGTGIGLAIVRKAIERMGGQVGVESQPGRGSKFWLDFKPATS